MKVLRVFEVSIGYLYFSDNSGALFSVCASFDYDICFSIHTPARPRVLFDILVCPSAPALFLDPDDPYRVTEETRNLGLVVCRGTAVMMICPVDGTEEIANPFTQG